MKNNFPNLKLVDHPLIKKDITLLRDKKTQPEYFRAAVRRISNILAVEIGMTLSLKKVNVDTPLERTKGYKLDQQIILIPVLRAGLSMVSGFLDVIPDCKVGHIGLQRNEETLEPVEYYFKIPNVDANSKIILLDPMLATGGSASQALKYLKKRGGKKIVFACLVAAPEGVKKIQKEHNKVEIYSAALDRELNNRGYILPGLGDAGDRTFGTI
ncbi:MAG: uracil phosphoribosyltransferase [Ignavibacteria bacterium GWA2_35_9]|nr:MAG: uracil phosphoribosyltransferase [Ignavibacteria bacterium GWA2_35_9]OGU49620.1 MAG: uracil phosphoribosyltransferase [Ignavibacteria bacterium GWC2_36_12]OGV09661.1 MAG: uracil phosphoribosyltransferase [Ignavibacteria bacterium RIFOXYB2_FULL_36_7]